MFFQKLLNEINNTYGIKEKQRNRKIFLMFYYCSCPQSIVWFSLFHIALILTIGNFFKENNFKESIILNFEDFFTPLWFTMIYIVFLSLH